MKEKLLTILENSKQYTLSVGEKMPENAYQFKPVDEVWNFRELLNHIAYGIRWWNENYIKNVETAWQPPALKSQKEEIIKDLTDAYESLKNAIDDPELGEDGVNGFHATIDHITHHRGQAVLYLRCKGIKAPEYIY